MKTKVREVVVLGASGYVGAEILRLLAQHPEFELIGAFSRTARPDIGELHPHLAPAYGGRRVNGFDELSGVLDADEPLGVFLAVPHGESAALAARIDAGRRPCTIVDSGADFRLEDAERFTAVYGVAHGAPSLYPSFHCGIPDLEAGAGTRYVAHPGCFTTAVCLGLAPIIAAGLTRERIVASCVTGSSGSGATPSATTHHPARHGSMRGYGAFAHRHRHEMRLLLERLGDVPELTFLPHSGPFVRGIHATLSLRLDREVGTEALVASFEDHYAGSPFITVGSNPPAITEVRGSNAARIGVAADGRDVVVYVVIDNLVKGAAGGAVQWMNRLCGLEPSAGLTAPALAWS